MVYIKKIFLAFFCLLILQINLSSADQSKINPDEIAATIFLGQAYPSGRLYIKAVAPSPDHLLRKIWPQEVFYSGLASTHPVAALLSKAIFKEELNETEEKNDTTQITRICSHYIPGLEDMWEGSKPCDQGNYIRNPKYKYLETPDRNSYPDFFEAIDGYCEPSQISIYSSREEIPFSFEIIAFSIKVKISKFQTNAHATKRPLYPGEAVELKNEKALYKKQKPDCTTVPVFIDSAIELLSAELDGTNCSFKLSRYTTPGCAGHLATRYILDLFEKNRHLKRYDLIQPRGLL